MSVTRDAAPDDDLREATAVHDAVVVADVADGRPASDGRIAGLRGPPPRRWTVAVQVVAAAVLGSVPVLWVLGALPWRSPTLLIENMFRGFVSCAHADGALTPIVMVCRRAGAPLGMYQLDGGLSYPLGGVLVRLGIEPQAAWKLSVAALILPGIGALFWLIRRMTGSPVLAAAFVGLNGLNGTLTARSWNWYWNVTAVVLLPAVFALLYVLFRRARARRLRALLLPGAATLFAVSVIATEWQYAGLFATAVAIGAVGILASLPGWTLSRRLLLVAGGAAGVEVVSFVLRLRLALAGVAGQYDNVVETAGQNAIDVVAFVAPDPRASLLGRLLDGLGRDEVLVGGLAAGRQLWVAPYLGIASTAIVLVVLLLAWRWRQPNPDVPIAFLVLLLCVTATSIVLSTGPQPQLAGASDPAATFGSPVAHLYGSDPLRWIRYPWTWGYLTHTAGMLTTAAAAGFVLRRGPRWSPLVGVLVVVLAVEFVSPQVIDTFRSARPSVATATSWTRVAADDPGVERFESQAIPELHRALGAIDGPVLLLPWGNTYIAPHLGPESGAVLRNVGIDRNLSQVEAAAPFSRRQLRRPSPETLQAVLSSRWAAGVVMLDHVPSGDSIVRFDHAHLRERDSAWMRRVTRMERAMALAGYCVTPHSWFTVFTRCGHDDPRSLVDDRARAGPDVDP